MTELPSPKLTSDPVRTGYESAEMSGGGFVSLGAELAAREFLPSELPDPAHAGEVFQRT